MTTHKNPLDYEVSFFPHGKPKTDRRDIDSFSPVCFIEVTHEGLGGVALSDMYAKIATWPYTLFLVPSVEGNGIYALIHIPIIATDMYDDRVRVWEEVTEALYRFCGAISNPEYKYPETPAPMSAPTDELGCFLRKDAAVFVRPTKGTKETDP